MDRAINPPERPYSRSVTVDGGDVTTLTGAGLRGAPDAGQVRGLGDAGQLTRPTYSEGAPGHNALASEERWLG
ncbi:hypothetical protein FCN77_08380 [Arthrobacter sp. 24S4-2]|uniref:hypothetical protein n=1 Tax=Arthrobacter sp. 24S4-2 TaxID=2575374 RepID=UPI0010C7D368|nr:hypothetical protein [Arthrobacter sp. 24S4-2]QCO97726.1 hypothetical protein FCN77_08380 [Arthrobacter sp. 24S4-2]